MSNMNVNDELDELIRSSTQVEIPADVEDRLRRRLSEFRTRVEQRTPNRLATLASLLMHLPPVRMTAMAAVILAALAVALVLTPRESRASQMFAAAAAHLRSSQSLQYTIVLNQTPYVAFDFSYLAPGYRRLSFSWGMEVRTDGTSGKQIVLMHATRTYLTEGGKQVESQADTESFAGQLRSLPQKADEVLGEQWTGGKKLIGYRLRKTPPNGSIPGLKQLDIWIDAATLQADHADIIVQEQGKPVHQMHIRNIRVGRDIDRSLFDLTPPVGYTAFPQPSGQPHAHQLNWKLPVEIRQTGAVVAVVVPMAGSYLQSSAAVQSVAAYLQKVGATPVGPPMGRYWSEQHWEAGYPVPPGTHAAAPFKLVSLPAGLVASAAVTGPWGTDSNGRWGAFLKSVMEQGYLPAGPSMEIWSGGDASPVTQSTEMQIPVTKAN